MSTPNPIALVHEPCWLVKDPTTSLTGTAYPYGGTELGFAREILVDRGIYRTRIIGEEFGGRTVRSSHKRKSLAISCMMRGWDANLLALLPGGAAANDGTWTSDTTNGTQPGQFAAQIKLLLVPDTDKQAGTTGQGIALILYGATVQPKQTAMMRRSYSAEFGIPVIWEAELDDNGNDWDEGELSTITLSP